MSLTPTPIAPKPKTGSPIVRHMRSVMIAGLLTLIPLAVSAFIVYTIFNWFTLPSRWIANFLIASIVAPALDWQNPEAIAILQAWTAPMIALVISILTIYIMGLLGLFGLGKRLLEAFEQLIENLPLVKGIYGTTKQVIGVFKSGSGGGPSFQRVVLVEFPRVGTWTVGFVTNSVHDEQTGQTLVCVFIPMTPNPTSGFFQMFPERDVRETDWSVDQGIKIVLSGGLLAPSTLSRVEAPPGGSASAAQNPPA